MLNAASVARAVALPPRLLRDRLEWQRRNGPLASEGYKIVPGFLPRDECERLVQVAKPLLSGGSRMLSDDAWFLTTADSATGYDQKLLRIMNAHTVDPGLGELWTGRRIETLFEEELGEPVVLKSITVQVDEPDTESKRSWHVDSYSPPTLKLFVYLTDVEGPQHGPYTVIPGSHRHLIKKAGNSFANLFSSRPATDLPFGYDDSRALQFNAPAGTAIMSVQSLAHKGWPEHTDRTRFMLVAYLRLAKYDDGMPFTLGRPGRH